MQNNKLQEFRYSKEGKLPPKKRRIIDEESPSRDNGGGSRQESFKFSPGYLGDERDDLISGRNLMKP